MNNKFPLFLVGVLTFFSSNIFSQETSTTPKTPPVLTAGMNYVDSPEYYSVGDVRGSIGEARVILLPKPAYSKEAKEAGAEGEVKVEIIIDKTGKVTSAKAVSGDSALYEAAENAALRSKFSTTKISQKAESYAAYLTYEFLVETPNWFTIGYNLGFLERFSVVERLSPGLIKKAFQSDWKAENDLIDQLKEMKFVTPEPPKLSFFNQKNQITRTSNGASRTSTGKLYVPQRNYDLIPISQNLISQLRGRLGNNEQNLWQFNLGISMIEFSKLYRYPDTRQASFEIIKNFIQNAPADTSPDFLAELQKLINLPDEQPSLESGSQMRQIIANLQKLR